jgi:peroxiredoxin
VIDPAGLPSDLPAPVDDGGAAHLVGTALPPIALPATDGTDVTLATVPGYAVVFAYPRTGRPGEAALVADWDRIPGARGCTPQTCGFRDLHAEFADLGVRVFGLSTQETSYQREMTERLFVPFPVLSDARLALASALRLPTFTAAGQTLLKRLSWIQRDGTIVRVSYPVFPPDRNADEVLAVLRTLTV